MIASRWHVGESPMKSPIRRCNIFHAKEKTIQAYSRSFSLFKPSLHSLLIVPLGLSGSLLANAFAYSAEFYARNRKSRLRKVIGNSCFERVASADDLASERRDEVRIYVRVLLEIKAQLVLILYRLCGIWCPEIWTF